MGFARSCRLLSPLGFAILSSILVFSASAQEQPMKESMNEIIQPSAEKVFSPRKDPDPHELLKQKAVANEIPKRLNEIQLTQAKDSQNNPPPELPPVDLIVSINQPFVIRPTGVSKELNKTDISIDRPDLLGAKDLKDQPVTIRNKVEAVFLPVKLGIVRITFHDSEDPSKFKTYTVRIVPDITYLNRLVRDRFPTANLNVVAASDNLLFVEGTVEKPSDSVAVERLLNHFFTTKIVNNIRIGGIMQVQLEVVIVRVDRQVLRRLGVNTLFADPKNGGGTTIGNIINTPAFSLPSTRDMANGASTFNPIGGSVQALTSNSTFFFGVTDSNRGLFAFIEALRQNNAAKVLANPTLVTYNGRTADFLVGGKQPIPTQGQNGIPVVQFEPFGTRLTFLPTILGDGKIRLEVVPEVSTIDASNSITVGTIQVPRFIVQRLHATVELQSSQTLCLGGLLQTEREAQSERIPVLGDLPGVGSLFRRLRHRTLETELLVLITPRLFDPLQPSQAPHMLPGQETVYPSDTQLFLNGQLESRRSKFDSQPPKIGDRISDIIAPGNRMPVPLQGGFEPQAMPQMDPPMEELPKPKSTSMDKENRFRVRGVAPEEDPSPFMELLRSRTPPSAYSWR